MPDQDGRETYGDAPGWSKSNVPITEEAQGAQETSPTPDAPAASSAEPQEQVTEQAPPPTSQPEPERKFHMPPEERWEELRQQRLQAEDRAAKAEQLAQLALQKLQNPQPQAEVDPYVGMDPQTAEFYRNLDRRIEQKASTLAEQKLQGVLQAVDAGRRELAQLKIAQFRKENPDIKPGSQEEATIASYVQNGVELETAKKLALFDKYKQELDALKTKQSAVTRKVAANVESSSGIPQTAGLPGKSGDWRQKASEVIDRGGDLQSVANALFGKRR